jgi:hypothetical protein
VVPKARVRLRVGVVVASRVACRVHPRFDDDAEGTSAARGAVRRLQLTIVAADTFVVCKFVVLLVALVPLDDEWWSDAPPPEQASLIVIAREWSCQMGGRCALLCAPQNNGCADT